METKIDTEETSFIFIDCPNCKDTRYASYSQGGFKSYGTMACTLPSCIVCNNWGSCIICYTCNAVQKYSMSGDERKSCDGCKKILQCRKHKWSLDSDENEIVCTKCLKVGKHHESRKCDPSKHIWTVANGSIKCSVCSLEANVF